MSSLGTVLLDKHSIYLLLFAAKVGIDAYRAFWLRK